MVVKFSLIYLSLLLVSFIWLLEEPIPHFLPGYFSRFTLLSSCLRLLSLQGIIITIFFSSQSPHHLIYSSFSSSIPISITCISSSLHQNQLGTTSSQPTALSSSHLADHHRHLHLVLHISPATTITGASTIIINCIVSSPFLWLDQHHHL